MLEWKTLLRLVVSAAILTGILYAAVELGRPWAVAANTDDDAQAQPAGIAALQSAPSAPAQQPAQRSATLQPAPAPAPAVETPEPVQAAAVPPPADAAPAQAAQAPAEPPAMTAALPDAAPADAAPEAPSADTPAPPTPAAQTHPAPALPVTGALSDTAGQGLSKKAKVKAPRGASLCQTFKSFNPTTQTYKGLDGKTHECRAEPLE
jgi:outer membrane biosynthesis protein TonB